MNNRKKKWKFTYTLAIVVLAVSMMVAVSCYRTGNSNTGQSAGNVTESRGEHGSGGEGRGEGSGEHGSRGESGGESGSEGSEGGAGGSEEGGNALALDETFDMVRAGARLIMSYDAAANAFVGSVANTTDATLTRVRIEVHLSNGIELGPTTPTDLAPGEILDVVLPASTQSFDGWTPHAEVGASEGGGEGSGEHGSGGEGSGESGSGEGSGESGDPSSPILALDESWDGVVNGVRTAMSYDPAARVFSGIVENTTDQTLCFVQIELNLKQGTTTVVELGPQPVGDLAPGAQTTVELRVADEPTAVGVAYDAWEIHPETFACDGPGPVNTEGSGGEGGSESGSEAGGEQHGAEGGGEGSEGGAAGSEEGGNALALDETFDMVRAGARLIMSYDAAANAFVGTVANTTNATLTRVRIEVHLSNGIELGPTTPTDLPPGAVLGVILPASAQPFDGWTPHAEVGGGEGGGEHGSGGGEGSGEHGGSSGGEGRGEHGGGGG